MIEVTSRDLETGVGARHRGFKPDTVGLIAPDAEMIQSSRLDALGRGDNFRRCRDGRVDNHSVEVFGQRGKV